MVEQVSIPRRFNGPLDSGNGGYCAGVFAALVDGPAAVDLRRPIPLEQPMDVVAVDAGRVEVRHGDELIAEAEPAPPPDLDVPEPVGVEQARAAVAGYRGAHQGPFSRCFVCGRGREDPLGVFAGAVAGRELVASPWTPPEWTAAENDAVRPELVWAVLDCPAVFASFLDSDAEPAAFLVRFNAELRHPVASGEEQVVIGWPLHRDGRKLRSASAVLGADGEVLAVAEALMVEPRAT
jgi:hypothetical protein